MVSRWHFPSQKFSESGHAWTYRVKTPLWGSDPPAPEHRHCTVASKTVKDFSLYSILLLLIWGLLLVWGFFFSLAAAWPLPAVQPVGVKERSGLVALTGGVEEPWLPAVVGCLLLTVLSAVDHSLQLLCTAAVVQGHGVGLLWTSSLHSGQPCAVVLHFSPDLIFC